MAKNNNKTRHTVQALWTALTNSYVLGFIQGKIYRGSLKKLCLPGLNCYSCPGALGSCPIGALQAVLGSRGYKMAFYVLGFVMLLGAFLGRFVCGWLCPFGLVQDLLHKIPLPKKWKIRTFKGDKLLRVLKYVILGIFVLLLPMVLVDAAGQGSPYFCKLICPAGTLGAGIPLVLLDESLRGALGWLYVHKLTILAVTALASIFIFRPFCKYICPLGALYSLFNPIAFYKIHLDKEKCTDCGACERACPMNVPLRTRPNSLECIRCGDCKKSCPTGAISMGFCPGRPKGNLEEENGISGKDQKV